MTYEYLKVLKFNISTKVKNDEKLSNKLGSRWLLTKISDFANKEKKVA